MEKSELDESEFDELDLVDEPKARPKPRVAHMVAAMKEKAERVSPTSSAGSRRPWVWP